VAIAQIPAYAHLSRADVDALAAELADIHTAYSLPHTTGPLLRQHWQTVRRICALALHDRERDPDTATGCQRDDQRRVRQETPMPG
jgi:hypothetical protein